MYRRVLAFDFDGTLAVNGDVPPEVETALEQCRASGHLPISTGVPLALVRSTSHMRDGLQVSGN
jgi:hydroxymethylpyrimidine pyrophosphatase-like HAD family hydrolase